MNNEYLMMATLLLIAIISQLPFGRHKEPSRKGKLMLCIFAGAVGVVALAIGLAPIELTVNGIPLSGLSSEVAASASDFLDASKIFCLILSAGSFAVAVSLAVEIHKQK